MLIGDGELYRLFFRWSSSEAKLTRRQRIRLLTRLNRLTKSKPIEAFSDRGSSAHAELVDVFTAACFTRRTVDACLIAGGPWSAMIAPAITAPPDPCRDS
jgi:hypothetical protein